MFLSLSKQINLNFVVHETFATIQIPNLATKTYQIQLVLSRHTKLTRREDSSLLTVLHEIYFGLQTGRLHDEPRWQVPIYRLLAHHRDRSSVERRLLGEYLS